MAASLSAKLIAGGARWENLYRLRDSGVLVEISRGVYRIVDIPAIVHLDLLARAALVFWRFVAD